MKTTINVNGKPVEIELTKEQIEAIRKASEKITDRVKTYEDACKELGINPQIKPIVADISVNDTKSITAYCRLIIIARALNEGWEPNWDDDDECKYYPYFCRVSPGAGFSFCICLFDLSLSYVGSRLVFKTSELAEYAGEQFESIYNDFLSMQP